MHISWFWAKQRPQFIAEHLSKENVVTVVYPQQFRSKYKFVGNCNSNLRIKYFLRIPGAYRIKLFGVLHDLFIAFQLWSDIRKTDIIWVTHPFLFRYLIFFNLGIRVKLVYDCMDDVLAFPDIVNNAARRKSIYQLEKALLSRSRIIFSTSNYLSQKLKNRYGLDISPTLVNNAINIESFSSGSTEKLPEVVLKCFRDDCINLVYVGTISSWLDIDLIRRSVGIHDNLNYVLVGPSEISLQNQDRLNFPGPIKHELVPSLLSMADVLIMPFVLSELVLSVNPVKLYEYVYSNKPTVSIRYGETEQFAPYVMLYKGEEEYLGLMQRISLGELPEINVEANVSFVKSNNWNSRVEIIQRSLRNEI